MVEASPRRRSRLVVPPKPSHAPIARRHRSLRGRNAETTNPRCSNRKDRAFRLRRKCRDPLAALPVGVRCAFHRPLVPEARSLLRKSLWAFLRGKTPSLHRNAKAAADPESSAGRREWRKGSFAALWDVTGPLLGIHVQLHRHQHSALVSDRTGAVALLSLGLFTVLSLSQGELARSLFDTGSVHALDPPASRQHHDPLRSGIFVPGSHPADRLHREHNGRGNGLLLVVPLRIGGPHALEHVVCEVAFALMTDTIFVDPQMPVGNGRFRSRIAHHLTSVVE